MKTLIVASMLGLAAGQYSTEPSTSTNTVPVTMERVTHVPTTTLQLSGTEQRSPETNQAIAQDVEVASVHLDQAFDQAPHVAAAMARSINEHGPIKAILYDDPEVKSATNSFATSLGRGLRALGDAVAKDMTEGTKQLHAHPG